MRSSLPMLLILLHFTSACFNSSPSENGTTSSEEGTLSVTTSSIGWPGLCQKVDLSLIDSRSNTVNATTDVAIDFVTTAGGMYSDAACTTATTEATILQGSSLANVYFKSAVLGTATLTISSSNGTNTSDIVVSTPTAVNVLGQLSFLTNTANSGGVSAQTLSWPYDVFVSSNQYRIVADARNNRVLIWNTPTPTMSQAADIVLGQPNMNSNTENNGGISASIFSWPECVYTNGTRLFICDSNNNRILIWNTIPTSHFAPANIVIGQPDMVSSAIGSNASSLSYPVFAKILNDKLMVTDWNNRILIWNSVPTTNGVAANVAIGQPDLTSITSGLSASQINLPADIQTDSQGRLFIVDYNNNRILIWNSVPTSSGVAADAVIGQPDFVTATANFGGVSSSSIAGPWGLDSSGSELWVTDYSNHRILQFDVP